eukprot:524-Pyramimonas_sp.AAC.2
MYRWSRVGGTIHSVRPPPLRLYYYYGRGSGIFSRGSPDWMVQEHEAQERELRERADRLKEMRLRKKQADSQMNAVYPPSSS